MLMERLQTESIHTYTNSKLFLVRELLFKAQMVTCKNSEQKHMPYGITLHLHQVLFQESIMYFKTLLGIFYNF